eukprot:5999629-Heterocapsa_arctica.AAC.1
MTSEGYQEPEGRIPGMTTVRLDIRDPFGLWIEREKGNIPWRWCPLASCACALPAAYTVCPFCGTPLVFTPAPADGAAR